MRIHNTGRQHESSWKEFLCYVGTVIRIYDVGTVRMRGSGNFFKIQKDHLLKKQCLGSAMVSVRYGTRVQSRTR
jgi:hypothetical protein